MRHGLLHLLVTNNFFEVIVAYNAVLFVIMTLIYHAMDFEKHFTLPNGLQEADTGLILYYVLMCQSNVMSEITPKTKLGRGLLSVHIALSWAFIMVLLAPWST